MQEEILKLRKALICYEECIYIDAAEDIMTDSLLNLGYCCQEVNKKCQAIFNAIIGDN